VTVKSIVEKEIDRDQPVKLSFHKGRTFRTGEYESLRVDYSIEIEVPRWQVLDTVENFDGYLDYLLEQQKPEPPPAKSKGSTTVQILTPALVAKERKSLRGVLEEEKRDTIARTEPTSPQSAPASAPSQNTQKPEPADPYASLPWRPSKNDANLSMIRVNDKLTPLARELYQKLEAADKKALRIGDATYKRWVTGDGAEFLQKWAKPRGGS
jgi:hypothetical protein